MLKLHSDNISATQFRVVTERVKPVNCARPFLVRVLILQAITPSAKKWSGYARLEKMDGESRYVQTCTFKKSRAFVNVIVDIRFESINACTVQKAVARIP